MRETLGHIATEVILFPFFAVGWLVGKAYSAYTLMRDAGIAGFNS